MPSEGVSARFVLSPNWWFHMYHMHHMYVYIHIYIFIYIHTYRQAGRHTDIQTYRHTYIQAGRQTGRHPDIQTYRHTDIHTYICIYIYIHIRININIRYIYIYILLYMCVFGFLPSLFQDTLTPQDHRFFGPLGPTKTVVCCSWRRDASWSFWNVQRRPGSQDVMVIHVVHCWRPRWFIVGEKRCLDWCVRAERRVAGWVGNGVAGMMTFS